MEEIKFCAVCGKQLEKFWVGGQVQDKDVLFCSECATEVLMKKQWILEDENQSLKDRWQKLKEYAEKHFEEEPSSLAVAFRKILVRMQELEKE